MSSEANEMSRLAGSTAKQAPTEQSYALYEELAAKIDAQLRQLNQVMTTDLKSFNNLVRTSDIPAVIIRPSAPAPAGTGSGGGDEQEN